MLFLYLQSKLSFFLQVISNFSFLKKAEAFLENTTLYY